MPGEENRSWGDSWQLWSYYPKAHHFPKLFFFKIGSITKKRKCFPGKTNGQFQNYGNVLG